LYNTVIKFDVSYFTLKVPILQVSMYILPRVFYSEIFKITLLLIENM